MNDPVSTWIENHPSTVGYIAFVVTVLLILEIAELVTTG
jgi:hypothetical protein